MRNYSSQKSSFCNKDTALKSLNNIAKNTKYKYLILSYNTEGIMSSKNIAEILNNYGAVELVEFEYLRFKSNNKGKNKTKKYSRATIYS